VNNKVESWRTTLPLLERKEIPAQLAILIARWCMVAKPNSLARSLPPTLTQQALKLHDEEVVRTVERRLHLNFSGFSREVLQTSMKGGGVGFAQQKLRA